MMLFKKKKSNNLLKNVEKSSQSKIVNDSNKKDKKIKLLVYGDSPTCATGFAQVLKNVIRVLYDTGKYDIDWLAINFDGNYYDRNEFPYKLYPAFNPLIPDPAYQDLYGRQKLLDMLGTGKYDLLFTLQDAFIMVPLGEKIVETNQALPADKKFRWIYYFPIDATPSKSWIDNSVLLADYPVAYTKYGYDECLKIYKVDEDSKLTDEKREENKRKFALLSAKLNVIYHGVNLKDFYPIEDKKKVRELRQNFFGKKNVDKFIFMNLNRNQPRKDLFRSMLAFKKLLDRRRAKGKDDVYFYFHCQYKDVGLNLIEASKQLQLVQGDEWGFPNPRIFGANKGFPISVVNELYNSVDCVVSTTLGEGWGLSTVEAMAAKKLIVMPNNTSLPEIIGSNERGILVKTSDYTVLANDNDRVRPVTDVDDLVDKMEWAIENKNKTAKIAEKAYKWVKELSWGGRLIGDKWKLLFDKGYEQVIIDRQIAKKEEGVDFSKLGRNSICPVCGIKFKKCIHYENKKSIYFDIPIKKER